MVPGLMFSIKTSAPSISLKAALRPSSLFRSRRMFSLHMLHARYTVPAPLWRGGMVATASPSGGSTLTTLAPSAPSSMALHGPTPQWEKSMTFIPSRGPAIAVRLLSLAG